MAGGPLFAYPPPTVAAINGHAYAGGLITALGCDYRIASEGTLEFSLNEVPIGISFGRSTARSSSMRLVRAAATELTPFSKVYDLGAALKISVIGKTVAPNRLPDEAVAWTALRLPDASAKRALQATTMAAIEVTARLHRDWLSRGMSDSASLRAHTDKSPLLPRLQT
jgi:enoyl-CoA hydratase